MNKDDYKELLFIVTMGFIIGFTLVTALDNDDVKEGLETARTELKQARLKAATYCVDSGRPIRDCLEANEVMKGE